MNKNQSTAMLNGSSHQHDSVEFIGRAPENYRPQNIAGKAVVMSGGTTGIGRAIARLLVERGARVLIYGRDENDMKETLQELTSIGEAHGVSADQSKLDDIRHVFETADSKLGGIDILINNAAVAPGSVMDTSPKDIAYGVNTNIVGYMACAHEAITRMKKRQQNNGEDDVEIKGHIINVGSLSAEVREAESDVYVATKAAIQAFSESLRKGANPHGIKVSLIEPGLVISDMVGSGKSPEEIEEMKRSGNILEPEDIAEAVHYILTQPARCDVINVQIRPHCQLI